MTYRQSHLIVPRFYPTLFFFFHSSGPHRALHSFPTRRSSDLHRVLRDVPPPSVPVIFNVHYEPNQPAVRRCLALRSEEHTSELQSPCNLVCRLLLEKKKYNCNKIKSSRPTKGNSGTDSLMANA